MSWLVWLLGLRLIYDVARIILTQYVCTLYYVISSSSLGWSIAIHTGGTYVLCDSNFLSSSIDVHRLWSISVMMRPCGMVVSVDQCRGRSAIRLSPLSREKKWCEIASGVIASTNKEILSVFVTFKWAIPTMRLIFVSYMFSLLYIEINQSQ